MGRKSIPIHICQFCKKGYKPSPQSYFHIKRKKTQFTYCSKECYWNMKRTNSPYRKRIGKPFISGGYMRIKIDGKAIGYHRYVMQNHLGRLLDSSEHIHHINHDPLDNRIENLEIISNSKHMKLHKTKGRYIKCSNCSKEVWRSPSSIKKNEGVAFCNYKCKNSYYSGKKMSDEVKKNMSIAQQKRHFKNKKFRTCDNCFNKFHRCDSEFNKRKKHFCSNKCRYSYNKKSS